MESDRAVSEQRAADGTRPASIPSRSRDPRSRSRARGPVSGVTFRLMALVLVPVTVMCVLSGSIVVSHRSAAAAAEAVDRRVSVLSELSVLRSAIEVQLADRMFEARIAELGVPRAAAIELVGYDWTVGVSPARARADRTAASLGHDSPVSAGALHSLNTEIDGASISLVDAAQRLRDFSGKVSDAMTRAFDHLGPGDTDRELGKALESLRTANSLVDFATPQLIDLTTVMFSAPGDTQATAAALARLEAEHAGYAEAVGRLHSLGISSVDDELERIEAHPEVRSFERAVANTLAGQPLTEAGVPVTTADAALNSTQFATTIRGYLTRDSLLSDLLATATTTARDEAQRLADSERTALMIWALGSGALALVTIGIALRVSRSISKPLKDLARYARAVTDGRLDVEPSARRNRGPSEISAVSSALTDLVANLRLLDTKANALAHCDFDDPALREPLPGRIGQSLASSVTLLSGSIVERDQLQEHLAHQATHDVLTGIGNRTAAITEIQAVMQRGARTGATNALLFIDLNEFKTVNDSHGHEAGDEVLRQVASRLSLGLRGGDFVARLGGDEFVVIAEGIADVADASDLAQRLIDAIAEPIDIGAAHVTIGAAIGIAMSLDGPEEPLSLLGRADAAMYRAKHHERSAIEIFDADLQRQLLEREEISSALAAALADPAGGGLQLHYQPVLDTASGALVGTEALIRWERAGLGLLVPDSFIPIAERSALIIDLDCWVLAEAARQLVAWSSVPELAEVPVAVNISGRHLLSRQLPGHVRAVLDQTGIDPHRLSIEITETVLLTDLVSAAAELDAVRAMGVHVAIDDFGTGYTSLAHLQQLPIDTIKIDRSFISQLNVRRGSSLVRMVTDLGHAIDINIVAEGVETDEELSTLRAIGADHLQGYLLSRPLEPAVFSAWAHEQTAVRCRLSAPSV